MTTTSPFSDYTARLRPFIDGASDSPEQYNELALALFRLQFDHVAPYRRFCESRKVSPQTIKQWNEIPAVPTMAFKEWDISSLSPTERTAVFHSSGTTEQRPSRHFHNAESLSIYEQSLLRWFAPNFLADWDDLQRDEVVGPLDKPGFIALTPSPGEAPNSSLVHMFDTVQRELGSRDSFFGGRVDSSGAWTLDLDRVLFGIRKSMCANRPIAILGTAFSFVHLIDHFEANNMRYRLAAGSRILETGGYKGRSREIPKHELHALLTKHLGIPKSHTVCEYGMSELSSQAYDVAVNSSAHANQPTDQSSPLARRFHFPHWARAQVISPETGREVQDGETGLIRIFDLANVRSVMAIQTEDLGIRCADGFELIGRAAVAEPRGCSLMPA